MTSRRNPDAQKKSPRTGKSEGQESQPRRAPILSSWATRGNASHDPAASPEASTLSINSNPAHEAVAVCFDKAGLARFLGLSVRSLDRANAMGLLPCPDLVCGRSPRWSPSTIAKWLKTRPKLPGRGGHHG